MKPINFILSTLIITQGLCLTIDAKAASSSIVDISRNESTSPISHPKSLVAAFKYVRPKTADNGSPFPKSSGYIKGYPIQFKEGLSSITVDNSKNSSDIFMKLYTLNSTPPQAIRVFFIRKGEKFIIKNVKAGSYDLRFRDLNYGGLSRTDEFNLEEYKEFDGSTKFHRFTLILKSQHGNIKMYPISEQEF